MKYDVVFHTEARQEAVDAAEYIAEHAEFQQLHFQSYREIFTIVGSVVHVRHYAPQELEET